MGKQAVLAGKHCCDEMSSHIDEAEVPLIYIGKFREYGIKISDGGRAIQEIKYCPWCGKNLPGSLRDEWFDIVFDKLGLDGPDDPSLPSNMKTEEWWLGKSTR